MRARAREPSIGTRHWLDTVYPPLLALTLALAFHLVLPRRLRLLRAVLIALAVVPAGFDLLENARVRVLLQAQPEAVTDAAIAAASRATLAKSMLSTAAFAALLAAAAAALIRKVRR